MRAVIATAPEVISSELRDLNVYRLLERASVYRPGRRRDLVSLTKVTLRILTRRAQALDAEIAELDAILEPLVAHTAPALVARSGIGTECASALLVAAGDNPERLRKKPPSLTTAASRPSTPAAANTNGIGSTAAVTARPTPRSGGSSSPGWSTTPEPTVTSSGASSKA